MIRKFSITNNLFKTPVVGVDPITKGKFTIDWAYMSYSPEEDTSGIPKAIGFITIDEYCPELNPLYKIAEEFPLRLQGLVANVDFKTEKRFIKIEHIGNYRLNVDIDDSKSIVLRLVSFEILDNLDFIENLASYRWDNLI